MKLLEDIFFAVYYGLEDLGLDVIWVRCPNLAAMCATDEALEHRQVSPSCFHARSGSIEGFEA